MSNSITEGMLQNFKNKAAMNTSIMHLLKNSYKSFLFGCSIPSYFLILYLLYISKKTENLKS